MAAEAMRAVGAPPELVFDYGVRPHVLSACTRISLLRWDTTVRASTLLGLVKAGGIRLKLNAMVNA